MRRVPLVLFVCVLCALAASRDGYRSAYRAWRELDPVLERDAGSPGIALGPRVDKVAAALAQYSAERRGFLQALAAERQDRLAWLEAPPVEELKPDALKAGVDRVAAATAAVERNMAAFASDTDAGIQQLQTNLRQEHAALATLSAAVSDRQKTFDALNLATAATEQARARVLGQERDLIAGLKQAVAESDRQTAAWVEYYANLAAESRGVSLAPNSSAAVTSSPATPRPPSITSLPLVRYTGAWTFPTNGVFHGPQPEFIDLVVHEDNGHADGTLFGRFKTAPGSKDEPVLRFDFSGDFRSARTQVFSLETSDGAKGTIELIPGPAFNLLEVNFQTEPKPGKIHQANVVLVKK